MTAVDEHPTPKESGTLERWPIFEKFAKEVAGRLDKPEDVRDAKALAAEFSSWAKRDPGQEQRMRALGRLFLYREIAGL